MISNNFDLPTRIFCFCQITKQHKLSFFKKLLFVIDKPAIYLQYVKRIQLQVDMYNNLEKDKNNEEKDRTSHQTNRQELLEQKTARTMYTGRKVDSLSKLTFSCVFPPSKCMTYFLVA